MEFGHDNVKQVVEEDRLSSLPDELIYKIMSCIDMKFAVQTSVLSSRWKLLWTSMPCLNFSSGQFASSPKFAEFVTHVLSHRSHQIEVPSVELHFCGAIIWDFVEKIADYAFSHNVQQLTIVTSTGSCIVNFPPCLFSSQSLKHFSLAVPEKSPTCIILDTPLDFPAVTTMHLSGLLLSGAVLSGDLFSKCVNLKTLTLQDFYLLGGVLDIITPHLSNLMLKNSTYVKVINVMAPELENLTLIDCSSIEYLNSPPGLLPLSKNGFHSLNKVTVCFDLSWASTWRKEEVARNTIKILQKLHSARYLTLSAYVIECLSSFSDLLSHHPSPFSSLISLTIDSSMMNDGYKVDLSTEARNFLLEKSPDATLILKSLEVPSRS